MYAGQQETTNQSSDSGITYTTKISDLNTSHGNSMGKMNGNTVQMQIPQSNQNSHQTNQMTHQTNQVIQQGTFQQQTNNLQQQSSQSNNSMNTIPSSQMHSILNTMEHASNTNMTRLPSRDIPMSQTPYISDIQSQPNFVPDNRKMKTDENDRFIEQEQEREKEYRRRQEKLNDLQFEKNVQKASLMNKLIDKIHIPIIFGCMYFIFNSPIVNSKMYNMFPSLFLKETKLSLQGHAIKAICFGVVSLSSIYALNEINMNIE